MHYFRSNLSEEENIEEYNELGGLKEEETRLRIINSSTESQQYCVNSTHTSKKRDQVRYLFYITFMCKLWITV